MKATAVFLTLVFVPACLAQTGSPIAYPGATAAAAYGIAGEDEIERRVDASQRALQALRYEEAEQHLTAALALDPPPTARAAILQNLGLIYHELGKYQQAETCFRQALDAWKRAPAPDELKTFRTLNNLATHYIETGQYGKAERLGLEAYVPRIRGRGDSARDLAWLFGNLGVLSQSRGDYVAGEE